MNPIADIRFNITCNSDCHKCCPSFLKFFCICWICKCGCEEEVVKKTNQVALDTIEKAKENS